MNILPTIFIISAIAVIVKGHGYLIEPPSRNSAWRIFGINAGYTVDYDDNGLSFNDICGSPRHSNPGKIVKTYKAGQTIQIQSVLTANHLGNIQVAICPNSNPTQECFEKNLLEVVSNAESGDIYKARIVTQDRNYNHDVKIPSSLSCTRCVLQWKWFARLTGEVYSNCADITVLPSDEPVIQTTQSSEKPSRILVRRTTSTTVIPTTALSLQPSRILRTRSTSAPITTTLKRRDPSTIRFICSKSNPPPKNSYSDQFKFQGSAIMCFWVDKTSDPDCNYCKDNCVTDEYECPPECDCRWYA